MYIQLVESSPRYFLVVAMRRNAQRHRKRRKNAHALYIITGGHLMTCIAYVVSIVNLPPVDFLIILKTNLILEQFRAFKFKRSHLINEITVLKNV